MAKMIVIYKQPADPKAFDEHYFGVHIPLAKKMPGLRRYDVSKGPIVSPRGESGVYLIGTLHFDDMAALDQARASAEGEACRLDVANYARPEDVQIFMFDDRPV